MPKVIIRDLTRADKPEWQSLWAAYIKFYKTSLSPQMHDLAFERLLSEDENEFQGMLARIDGKPAGLVHTLTHRHGWFEDKVIYLQDLFSVPEVRGKGVGRALIEEVYRRADIADTPNVYWLTAKDNIGARRLYDNIASETDFIKYKRP
ncbi:MAG: GNAT family N-acetyltransferase [Devosiaceae bacterium]|nr:GNAT family N-acetyltransferase [Devosiaceae bacterium]